MKNAVNTALLDIVESAFEEHKLSVPDLFFQKQRLHFTAGTFSYALLMKYSRCFCTIRSLLPICFCR